MRDWEVWDEDRAHLYAHIHGSPCNPKPAQRRRMITAANLLEGFSALDVGCGIGHLYPLLKYKVEKYVGVDNSRPMLERANLFFPHATFTYGSVFKLGRFGTYDTVYCLSTLMHLPEIEQPINELWKHTHLALILGLQCAEVTHIKKTPYKDGYLIMRRDPVDKIVEIIEALPQRSRLRRIPVEGTQDIYFKVWR